MNSNRVSKTVLVFTHTGSCMSQTLVSASAEEGCNIIVADVDEIQAQKVANKVNEIGGKACAIKADVTDLRSVSGMMI